MGRRGVQGVELQAQAGVEQGFHVVVPEYGHTD